jgi:hypothetical protein
MCIFKDIFIIIVFRFLIKCYYMCIFKISIIYNIYICNIIIIFNRFKYSTICKTINY